MVVRLFISLAPYDWDLHQLDIRNLSTWRSSGRSLNGATSRVCCSGGDREGVLSSKIFVWLETKSSYLI